MCWRRREVNLLCSLNVVVLILRRAFRAPEVNKRVWACRAMWSGARSAATFRGCANTRDPQPVPRTHQLLVWLPVDSGNSPPSQAVGGLHTFIFYAVWGGLKFVLILWLTSSWELSLYSCTRKAVPWYGWRSAQAMQGHPHVEHMQIPRIVCY